MTDLERAEKILKERIADCKSEYWELTPGLELLKFEPMGYFPGKEGKTYPLFTDGEYLHYDSGYIRKLEKEGQTWKLDKEILHILFHLLLGDINAYRSTADPELFNKYSDLRAELLVHAMMGIKPDTERRDLLAYMSGKKKIPDSFTSLINSREERRAISELSGLKRDSHDFWDSVFISRLESTDEWDQARRRIFGVSEVSYDELMDMCELSAKESGRDKGEKSERFGSDSMSDVLAIKDKGEPERDYKDLLRKLFKCRETSVEDDSSMDRMLYSYGLSVYDDVLLVEPDPEPENDSILKNLAIAIDTSGSCSGETVSVFVRELAGMVRDMARMGVTGRVTIYQCDADIKDVKVVEDLNFLEDVISKMTIKGGGGTDFRPVFKALDREIKEGRDVTGLLYLTDGVGAYPDSQPDYPVYFVLEQSSYQNNSTLIPKWVQKTVIE